MGLLQEGLISTSRALRANLPRVEQRQHRGNHTHRHRGESWRRLSLVLLLTAFYMFAEVGAPGGPDHLPCSLMRDTCSPMWLLLFWLLSQFGLVLVRQLHARHSVITGSRSSLRWLMAS